VDLLSRKDDVITRTFSAFEQNIKSSTTRKLTPENCSAYVPMILKEFCSSKINGLVMKNFSGK
jgi:hypothetical protein